MAAEQERAVLHVMEVTACDQETASLYLERCNYNVEAAVRSFFDGVFEEDEAVYEANVQRAGPPTPAEEYADELDNGNVAASREVQPRSNSLAQFLATLVTLPVRLPIYLLSMVWNFVRAIMGHNPTNGDMHNYISTYHREYENKKDAFFPGDLRELRTMATRRNWRFFVVYIHDHQNSDTVFLKNLMDSNVSRLISNNNAVLFGTLAGGEDATALWRDMGSRRDRSAVLIYKIQGNQSSRVLLIDELYMYEAVNRNIVLTLEDLNAEWREREAVRTAQNESSQIMEMQNREYQESLERDLARIQKEKEQKEAVERERIAAEAKANATESNIQVIREYKMTVRSKPEKQEGSSQLLLRFPNGTRKILKFNPTDRISGIFDAVMRSDDSPTFFQLHTVMPKKAVACLPQWFYDILEKEETEPEINCLDSAQTFEEAEISSGSTLYVDNL